MTKNLKEPRLIPCLAFRGTITDPLSGAMTWIDPDRIESIQSVNFKGTDFALFKMASGDVLYVNTTDKDNRLLLRGLLKSVKLNLVKDETFVYHLKMLGMMTDGQYWSLRKKRAREAAK